MSLLPLFSRAKLLGMLPSLFTGLVMSCMHLRAADSSSELRAMESGALFALDSPSPLTMPPGAKAFGRLYFGKMPDWLAVTDGDSGSNFILRRAGDKAEWNEIGRIEEGADLASLTAVDDSTVILLAISGDKELQSIHVLRSDLSGLSIERLSLPPVPVRSPSVSMLGSSLFLAGLGEKEGVGLTEIWELSAMAPGEAWKELPPPTFPLDARKVRLLRAHGSLLLLGESDTSSWAWKFRLGKGWCRFEAPPAGSLDGHPVLCGESHLLLFGVPEQPGRIVSYHEGTSRWVILTSDRIGFAPAAASRTGIHEFLLLGEGHQVRGQALVQPTHYGWVDHAVVFLFMAAMLWVGLALSKRETSNQDYFRGGRRVPFWASGLSLFATGASAISLMAMPGMAFATDWTYLSLSLYIMVSTLVVLFVYVPLARQLDVSTANEYLERRFGLSLRLIGSLFFSLNQILARLAAIMLLPAIAISSISGMPMEMSILLMGVVTTVYSTMGGLEGVIWTDVIQAVVMILAVLVSAGWALAKLGLDLGSAFATAQSLGKLNLFDPSLGLLGPTMFVLFLNGFATVLTTVGDQNFIQRVQCTPTERDAKKAVLTQILVAVPLNGVLFSLGTILFVFYLNHPQLLNPTIKADGIFPIFAAQNLPPGLAGIVIAALFAATMSTLSSALNSTANIGVEDFFRRLRRTPPSDAACLRLGKVLTLALGLLGTGAALWLANSEMRSVWDLAIMLSGMILGPISGFFLLGIFSRRAHTTGVLVGGLAAVLVTFGCRLFLPIHHFLYLPVGVATSVTIGLLASLLLPGGGRDLRGLTIHTLYAKKPVA